MANEVELSELDASDLSDILTEMKGSATKVKNVAAARKELAGLLESQNMVLGTDDDGNFTITPKKPAKGKAAAKPEPAKKGKAAAKPEPEEDEEDEEEAEEEEAEEEAEEGDEEDEEEAEEEAEEEDEEEVEETPPPKKGKAAKAAPAKAAPAKAAPAKKGKAAKAKADDEEDEDEEVEAKPKKGTRPPPPRESRYKDSMKIAVQKKDTGFKEGSNRATKWGILRKSKTVGEYLAGCREAEVGSAPGFLKVCVDAGYITVT
jgi:hypothetical protein